MTEKQALARLKYDRAMCNFNPLTGEEEPMNEDCKEAAEALDVAIGILEEYTADKTSELVFNIVCICVCLCACIVLLA